MIDRFSGRRDEIISINYNTACSFKSVRRGRSRRGSASRRFIVSGQRLVVVAKRFVGCRSIGAAFSRWRQRANGTASAVEVRSRRGGRSVRTVRYSRLARLASGKGQNARVINRRRGNRCVVVTAQTVL